VVEFIPGFEKPYKAANFFLVFLLVVVKEQDFRIN
jgi:hypothetical protein